MEVPDNDILLPGSDQWASSPTSAPEPPAGALVMREDGCVMPGRPTHGAEASSSCAAVDGVFWYTKHVHYTLVWI
jgi:hypothetical protein